MTPKMSQRRKNITRDYHRLIEAIYDKKMGYDVNEGGIRKDKWKATIDSAL